MGIPDRVIVVGAALPAALGFPAALGLTHDLMVSGFVGLAASLVGVVISLTPPVRRARVRLLRRKYPAES
jgi:hypothetical protein